VTGEYKSASGTHGFTAFAGDDARIQPGNLQEATMQEMAVAWARSSLDRTLPKRPREEDDDTYAKRLKAAAAYINDNYKVADLCLEFPARVASILEAEGGRIKK